LLIDDLRLSIDDCDPPCQSAINNQQSANSHMTTVPDAPISPTGEPAAPEHVGLAFRAMAAGALSGLGAVSTVMWLVRTLQISGAAPLAPHPSDMIANVVLFGWLGGALLGALIAWGIMAPIPSAYRRGGFAMVAGFGTLLLSFVTAPIDSLFGRWGLLGVPAVAALFVLALLRRLEHRTGGA
jgi:hypothetical protein